MSPDTETGVIRARTLHHATNVTPKGRDKAPFKESPGLARDGLRCEESYVALRGPCPRPFACPEIKRPPGDAKDVSRPGLDRWRCLFWLGS